MKKFRIQWSLALLMLGLLGLFALTLPRSRMVFADEAGLGGNGDTLASGLDWPQQGDPGAGYPPPTEVPPGGVEEADPLASPTAYPAPAPTEVNPFEDDALAPDIFEPADGDGDAGMLPPPPDAVVEEERPEQLARNTLILWIGFLGGLLVLAGGIYASILLYGRRNE